jgi:hypothetical protein
VIIFNKEVGLPKVNGGQRKAILAAVGVAFLLIVVSLGAFFINRQLSSSSAGSNLSLAGEGSPSALTGSHNECENYACVAKDGVGPNDCVTDSDCAALACDQVTITPPKPAVGESGVKFICQGPVTNSTATINSLTFKVVLPTGGEDEIYTCPSGDCTLVQSSGSYVASLSYPKALARGTYKVMTKTCFRLFSSNEICGDYRLPEL